MSTPDPPPKESFGQFVNRLTVLAALGSVIVLFLEPSPELSHLAQTVLRYAVTLWLGIVGVPHIAPVAWKHRKRMGPWLIQLRQRIQNREWRLGPSSADISLSKLPNAEGVESMPSVPERGEPNHSPVVLANEQSVQLGPYALFPSNPRPHSSSTLLAEQASELIFNTVQLAGLKMEEPPEILSIDAGPTLQTISFRLPARLQLSDLVKKRDDLANHIGHDRSFAVTSSPFLSAAAFILPHTERAFVYMSDMAQDLKVFAQTAELPMVFGKDMLGKPILVDLAKLPHLLVAGATGSGKSVFINGLLTSLASTRSPEQVQFLLIDPKMVEFTMYTGLPHLISPPVTDPKRAALTLKKLVVEMEKRYKRFAEAGVRNLLQYNRNHPQDQMPYIVTVIDEYADLMVIARADVEETVQRLTQMGRAAGLHLILGTQRPSVDVVTGVIKSNLPSRVAFHLLSVYDFKTVMDTGGQHLLGGGDGICMLNGGGQKRFQSAAISADDDETTRYIEELKRYWRNELWLRKVDPEIRVDGDSSLLREIADEEVYEPIDGKDESDGLTPLSVAPSGEWADLEEEEVPPINESVYDQVIRLAREHNGVSGRLLQHALNVDYVTAATYVEQLSKEGRVAAEYDPETGLKPWLADTRESDEELLLRMQRIICETRSARSAELQRELGIRKERVLKLMVQLVEIGFLQSPSTPKEGYTLAWNEKQINIFLNEKCR
ncbi:DNA translocase [Paenibacillus sp. FSL R7-269]|uniref:FtsK/SpoIIIE domain-containing protein n=1 Tax=Paenibacillus sp. FSL R7-269 TaxID=1226755 RepID=UPI0003E1B9EA|nr:FtsK/SpoIIIE domain-containing protein [Paenibacillus sp. FSL R7-269]ETT54777.1 DNA translocase [Paenibacillus sp. FSL R7-269]